MSDQEMSDKLIGEILAIYKRIDKGEIESEEEARTEIRKAIRRAKDKKRFEIEDMTIEEAYLKVSIAVSEARDEYWGRNLNQGTKDKLEDWDKALEIIGKELGIMEEME